jgi:hypothetical protein
MKREGKEMGKGGRRAEGFLSAVIHKWMDAFNRLKGQLPAVIISFVLCRPIPLPRFVYTLTPVNCVMQTIHQIALWYHW